MAGRWAGIDRSARRSPSWKLPCWRLRLSGHTLFPAACHRSHEAPHPCRLATRVCGGCRRWRRRTGKPPAPAAVHACPDVWVRRAGAIEAFAAACCRPLGGACSKAHPSAAPRLRRPLALRCRFQASSPKRPEVNGCLEGARRPRSRTIAPCLQPACWCALNPPPPSPHPPLQGKALLARLFWLPMCPRATPASSCSA